MRKNSQLEDLNVPELHILTGHLQLGITHLEKHLNDEQLEELLGHGRIEATQYQKIKSDELEKHGNITLMVNTVFTCVLGGWLASIGFIGMSPATNGYVLLFILIAAVIGSGYFGFISFKAVIKEGADALRKQQLANLQLKLLSLIEENRQQTMDELIDYLNGISDNFSQGTPPEIKIKPLNSFKSKEEFVQWFNEFNTKISEEINPFATQKIYYIFIQGIKKIKHKLEKAIDTNIGLVEHHEEAEEEQNKPAEEQKQKRAWFSLEKNKDKSFITVLTDPAIVIPKAEIKKKSFLKNNIYSLINGLIPTTLGGFCSLFTYFNGIPDIAKEFGIQNWEPFLESPLTKFASFLFVLSVTLYFGYLFIHGKRRSFQREQEYEKTQKTITNKEIELLAITSRINLFKKVKKHVENIFLIVSFMQHVSENLKSFSLSEDQKKDEIKQKVIQIF